MNPLMKRDMNFAARNVTDLYSRFDIKNGDMKNCVRRFLVEA